MTTEIFFASNEISVTDQQLQLMLDRFNLGSLISSQRPTNGVMGQTIAEHRRQDKNRRINCQDVS